MTKYEELAEKSLNRGSINPDDINWILTNEIDILQLLNSAYKLRKKYKGNKVKIHVINNVQNGGCSEDCKYCAQSKNAIDKSNNYPMKTEAEIIEEAKNAYEYGAYRYCMVFSGKDMNNNRIERITDVVKKIKDNYNMEVCVSAGFLTENDAKLLKEAGVNRYNHNLNTSKDYYSSICSTHEYSKRVETVTTARNAGLDICSGIIIGLGETNEDIIQIIEDLKNVKANSIPINFFIPIEDHKITNPNKLSPIYCLKILSLFRLALPQAEIRAAGGREYHLRGMQSLCLYAVDSVFTKGYLTTGGESVDETKQMILDAGFTIDKIEY